MASNSDENVTSDNEPELLIPDEAHMAYDLFNKLDSIYFGLELARLVENLNLHYLDIQLDIQNLDRRRYVATSN